MLKILIKLKEILNIILGFKQIINGFSKPVKRFVLELEEEGEPIIEEIREDIIQEITDKEKKFKEFIHYQGNEIQELNNKKERLLVEMGTIGTQLQFFKDDLNRIVKDIRNTTKFVKNANKYLGFMK